MLVDVNPYSSVLSIVLDPTLHSFYTVSEIICEDLDDLGNARAASSTHRSWGWPSRWASVDWRHATCISSRLFDSVMVAPSISSFLPATRTTNLIVAYFWRVLT